jgi:hypothetical protein
VLFLGILNEIRRFSGFLTMLLGLAASVITLLALIWKRERSWLVWLMFLPGLFAIAFSVAEILYPH